MAFAWKYQVSDTPENLIHIYLIPLSILLRLGMYGYFRLYDFSKQETLLDQVYYLFWAGTLASIGDWLALLILKTYYLEPDVGVSRSIILIGWLLILVSCSLWRAIYLGIRRKRGEQVSRVAIAGCGPTAIRVYDEIKQFAGNDMQIMGFIPCESSKEQSNLKIIGSLDTLESTLQDHNIDELILAPEIEQQPNLMQWIHRCEQASSSVRVRLHPDLAGLYVGRVTLSDLAGLPLVEIPDRWRVGLFLAVKRAMDILVAFFGLIVLLIPGLLISLGILLEGLLSSKTRGPVFFLQRRMGRNRKEFRLVKFRTMIANAETQSGPTLARKGDPRITRMGKILRRSGLDELPQLWNVLWGEMSLVGPRPERPEFVKDFISEHPFYELRLRLRPGITGLAQIHGHYHSSVASKLRYDVVYLANFSFFLDLKILFRTLHVILTGRKIEGQ